MGGKSKAGDGSGRTNVDILADIREREAERDRVNGPRGAPLPLRRIQEVALDVQAARPPTVDPARHEVDRWADEALRHLVVDVPTLPDRVVPLLVAHGALSASADTFPGRCPAGENRRRAWLAATSCLVYTAVHALVSDPGNRARLHLDEDVERPPDRESAVRGWLMVVADPTIIPGTTDA